jgi:hypothetical protein
MAHEAGKGSKSRPFSVSQDEYDKRWDAIFSRDLDEQNQSIKSDDDEQKLSENHTSNRSE